MFKSLLFSFLFLFSIQALADPKFRAYEQRLQIQQLMLSGIPIPNFQIKEGVFDQKLDHFSSVDNRTFKQRYWSASGFKSSSQAPVFLYICGEGACGSGHIYGMISAHAQLLGAQIFALEHRYYGQSQPFSDLSTANLKYLSTEQALRDLVDFQAAMNVQYGLSGRWFVFGGSYSGALAAFARSQYPDRFSGALASSAAVKPIANFSEYDHYVGLLAGRTCALAIGSAVREVEAAIVSDEGFQATKAKFQASQVSRRDDFIYLLSDVASSAIQLGSKEEFCQAVEARGADGYAEIKRSLDKKYGDYADYTAEVAEDTSIEKNSGAFGLRQWFYQSCTEYGFWQNAWPDVAESARSQKINQKYHDELCHRLFGFSTSQPSSKITNDFYRPLLSQNASQIYFTNGTRDPWASVSVRSTDIMSPLVKVVIMQDAGHCEDLGRGGSDEVMKTKRAFQDELRSWLK